jgi:hypothetical protein
MEHTEENCAKVLRGLKIEELVEDKTYKKLIAKLEVVSLKDPDWAKKEEENKKEFLSYIFKFGITEKDVENYYKM